MNRKEEEIVNEGNSKKRYGYDCQNDRLLNWQPIRKTVTETELKHENTRQKQCHLYSFNNSASFAKFG